MWSFLLKLLHVKWVPPWLGRDFIGCLNRIPVRKADRKVLKAVVRCLMWGICQERNRIVFKDSDVSEILVGVGAVLLFFGSLFFCPRTACVYILYTFFLGGFQALV